MNEDVYEHLPRWRRIIHDLAVEAGIKKFVKSSSNDRTKSSGPLDSSPARNEPEPREAEE